MDKLEEFRTFLKDNPSIINYLHNNKDSSIQKLYEIYDIYGKDLSIWKPYLEEKRNNIKTDTNLKNIFANIDMNSLQEHIKTAQKALGFIEELTTESAKKVNNTIVSSPRPLDKFFGD